METSREVYQAQFIEHSLTVKELKEILEGFEDDLPVITSHDRGYTYGSIRRTLELLSLMMMLKK